MNRSITAGMMAGFSFLCAATAYGAEQPDRPNILWMSLEDITPMMGCYGDKYARTPVFDGLAAEGIRYTKAHSIGAVCSVSRSSIITGMYPTSLGTHHQRSNVGQPPAFVKMLPNLMREAGYYTSNNAKKDYNIGGDRWHESSGKAHWRNRSDKGQPFFAVFNYGACHSSVTKTGEDVIVEKRLNRLGPKDFHDPAKAPIPPYHPDVPEFRKAWSRYYDAVTQVDYQAGELIEQLKADGLWENTLVFVWADHGVGMPRGKHNAWEQGTHVPLIVRFPKRYQHLAPVAPGSVADDLVMLMDMGPSVLAMAGIDTPDYMHGRPLLCRSDAAQRDCVVAGRDRLDSRYEMVRSIRDRRYRYQRNFYPHLPYKDAAPVLTEALIYPIPAAQIRAACILDSHPPEASADLQGAIGAPQQAAASTNVRRLAGIPYGLNDPFGRALKAIRGEASYYRWGMGASGAPENPLMKVQELPFVPRKSPAPSTKTGKASTLTLIGGKTAEVSSHHPGHEPEHMLDGNTVTFWHASFAGEFAKPPHYVVLEVPNGTAVAGLAYTARSKPNGRVLGYGVSVSDDGKSWEAPIAKGRLNAESVAERKIEFPTPTTKRFIKFEVTDAVSIGGQPLAAIGELDVLVE